MINLTPEEIRTIISATMLQHNERKLYSQNSKGQAMLVDAYAALRIAGERIIKASADKEYRLMEQWMRDNKELVKMLRDGDWRHVAAADALEAMAGGPTREDGRVQLCDLRQPATAPAPAVCEWTQISEFDTVIHYSTPHGIMNDLHLWRGLQCSACHAPIKFTEAKT